MYRYVCGVASVAHKTCSLVVWDAAFLLDSQLAKDLTREADTLNLHEMAHSFFGDHVTIRHFDHAWLKESWATYLEVRLCCVCACVCTDTVHARKGLQYKHRLSRNAKYMQSVYLQDNWSVDDFQWEMLCNARAYFKGTASLLFARVCNVCGAHRSRTAVRGLMSLVRVCFCVLCCLERMFSFLMALQSVTVSMCVRL